jgi:hypothetical protein
MAKTITSANSVLALSVTNLYPVPQIIQGFAADDAFTNDSIELAEVVMGVDGHLSAGYIFNPVKLTINIMPDSPSATLFDNWANATKTAREVYMCAGSIQLPSIGKKYTLINGVMTSYKAAPDARRVLQATQYVITFESVIGEVI